MRWNDFFIRTKREEPSEAEVVSHKLMLRAGMILKISSGIYTYSPLGLKVIRRVENIVREEMNRAGAIEVLMPIVIPKELWEESGRWNLYGKELLRFKDRSEKWLCLGPTHEEVITDFARREIKSYRDLPKNFYQIHTKFRDEIRPRFGLMRAREFIMKDAYSFDADERGAEKSYEIMFNTYIRIFKRCGLRMRAVEAETGAIGGSFSHEFMVLADTGEEIILFCENCSYSANRERAETLEGGLTPTGKETSKGPEMVPTPDKRTVEEVSSFLNISKEKIIKSLLYYLDETPVLVLIRGDMEANEAKIKRWSNANEIRLADEKEVLELMGAEKGFIGPIGSKLKILVDWSVLSVRDGVCGANKDDYHFVHVLPGRDFPLKWAGDFRFAGEGDICPKCKKGRLKATKGIEVGHTFKLGTKYSQPMNAKFLDKDGTEKPMVMGCYGIGIGRTACAAIEQGHDDKGIIFPISLAPFEAVVLPVNMGESTQVSSAERIYRELMELKIDAIIDDRDERIGVKLNDADLTGVPIKVIVGKKVKDGSVEIKTRDGKINIDVSIEECAKKVNEIKKEMEGCLV
jgi:prolyl-tRNA synthetase